MKKVFFILLLFSSTVIKSQQIVLNEVASVSSANYSQYLELFSNLPSQLDLSDYFIVIVEGEFANGGKTPSNAYIIDFPSNTFIYPSKRNFSISTYTQLKNGSATNLVIPDFSNFGSTTIKKYTYSGSSYGIDATFTTYQNFDFLSTQKKNSVFLFKKNNDNTTSLIDVFSNYSSNPTNLGSISNFTDNAGNTINFNLSQSINSQNISNANLGAGGSYGRIYDGFCTTNASIVWYNLAQSTPGQKNFIPSNQPQGGTNTTDPSWNMLYQVSNTTDRNATLVDFSTLNYTYSENNNSKYSVFDSTDGVRYVRLRTIIQNPLNTPTSSLFNLSVYKDENSNSILDDGDGNPITVYTNILNNGLTIDVFIPESSLNSSNGSPVPNFFLTTNYNNGFCFSTIQMFRVGLALLPVELMNFKVSYNSNKSQIAWSTASESNNRGFEIQRSIGTTKDFRVIGFVGTKAKQGNSQTEISYSFDDANVKAGQTHYYRLNQIDFDGKSSLSSVKSIKPGSIESNLNVYPNPSQGSFTVNTGSNSGKLNIFVMDNTGRVVNQFMNVSTSNTRINNLKKGFYTLKIVNTESGEQSAQKIVVQ
jgi:hypothetical protein